MKGDIAIIRKALRALRSVALSYRYGGMAEEWKLADQAQEALDRVETELDDRQMKLFEAETLPPPKDQPLGYT